MFDFNQYKLRFRNVNYWKDLMMDRGYSENVFRAMYIQDKETRRLYGSHFYVQHLIHRNYVCGHILKLRKLSHQQYCHNLYKYIRS